jgi:hypothetical protein
VVVKEESMNTRKYDPTPYVIVFGDGKLADYAFYASYDEAWAKIAEWVKSNKYLDGMYSVKGLRRG